jgi:signal peptidase II
MHALCCCAEISECHWIVKKYLIVGIIAFSVIGLDQLTKYIICQTLPLHQQIAVSHDFFHIIHIRNPGIAFGLLTHVGSRFKIPMLIFISGVAVVILLFFLAQIKEESRLQLLCFSLVLGGATGNLIDRFRFGEVIDFIYVHWYTEFYWPAFNVADSAISVGIMLLALDILLGIKKGKSGC